ncbi:hypothetical protein [Halobacillus sp. Marseille-Q1614]|uniref:hypothetical protein n=1 Tax=Halobacillus sp. Marseille-Q1614 TaxID=2709134 RepID=UPI00156FD538|nr:hypothetical protein [Halobacillus sp. Marseille-Q1614]
MNVKKLASFFICSLMLLTFSPMLERVEAHKESAAIEDKQQERELVKELEEHRITELHFVTGLDEELSSKPTFNEQMSKTQRSASDDVGEQMLKNLNATGEKEWNSSVQEFAQQLPIDEEAKETLGNYLSYDAVKENISSSLHSSNDLTEALTLSLNEEGLPIPFAEMIARTLVFLLY